MIRIPGALFICVLLLACNQTRPVPEVKFLSATPGALPWLYTASDQTVYLSWVSESGDSAALHYATLQGAQWTPPVTIASGQHWFVNWADYPVMAVQDGKFMAHVLKMSGEGRYSYDAWLTNSADGRLWSEPGILNDDFKEAEHGFVTILPWGKDFFVCWLDGRNAAMEGMEGMDHGDHGAMSLRAARFSAGGARLEEWELDNRTCDCCQTTAVMTSGGPVVFYRDRSDMEIRDMAVVRYENKKWSAPVPLHDDGWAIKGCPVNGPRAAAQGNNVAVAWFTAADDSARVHVSFSDNGGRSFGAPVQMNDARTLGRVDLVWINEEQVVVTWMEGPVIRAGIVDRSGRRADTFTVATSSEARASGFPQVTRAGDKLVFAWTDQQQVQTALWDIPR